jgi:hypothetical protein
MAGPHYYKALLTLLFFTGFQLVTLVYTYLPLDR